MFKSILFTLVLICGVSIASEPAQDLTPDDCQTLFYHAQDMGVDADIEVCQ